MNETFWSRRRAAVAAEAREAEKAVAAAALAEEHAVLEEQSDEEILSQLDLPDPDDLEKGDDFSVFLAEVVPDRIRRRALRTLWKSNPVLANVDHLVEYGDDYTDAATVVENLQTAYQVGKGMLKHVEEMARQASEIEAPEDRDLEEQDKTPAEEILAEAEIEVPEPLMHEDPPEPQDEVLDDVAPAPRRMKFKVEETA